MIQPVLMDDEYAVIMSALKECLERKNSQARHEELSWMYHSLGGKYGYGE